MSKYFHSFVFACLLLSGRASAETRGLETIPLLHEKFPWRTACEVLSHSSAPAFSYLWGTFGKNTRNVKLLTDCLVRRQIATRGRVLPLRIVVYITCEPCARPRRNGSFEHWASRYTLSERNARLKLGDKRLLREYERRLEHLTKVSTFAPHAQVVVVPSLEDNLTRDGFVALKRIISRLGYAVERNPLTYQRGPEPTHIHSYDVRKAERLRKGDTVSGDGVEGWPSGNLVRTCERKGVHFLLWRPEWQGVTRNPNLPPSKRTYRLLQISRLIRIMKGEL